MALGRRLALHADRAFVLDDVLDRHPLVAEPDTPLSDVLHLMSQAWAAHCDVSGDRRALGEMPEGRDTSSVVLMMSNGQLDGILTEHDLVRLTAEGIQFSEQKLKDVANRDLVTLSIDEIQDLFTLISHMRRHQIRHLPILDDQGQLLGLVTHSGLRQVLQPSDFLKLRHIQEVLIVDVVCVFPFEPIRAVTQKMTQQQSNGVVVVEAPDDLNQSVGDASQISPCRPIGVMTAYDIVQYQRLELNLDCTVIQDVMSAPLFVMRLEDSIWKAHQTMRERQVRRLVVIDERGELAGIVTQANVLQVLDPIEMYDVIAQLQRKVRHLQAEKCHLEQRASLAPAQADQSSTHDRQPIQPTASELSYRALAENLPAIVYRIFPDQDNRMEFLNHQLQRLTGYQAQDLPSGQVCSIDPLIVPEDRSGVIEQVQDAIARQVPFELNYRIRDHSGHIRCFWEQAQPAVDEQDRVSHYDGVIFDVTAHKEAEFSLQEERNFNDAILDTAGALVVVLDSQGYIIRFNAACVKLTGFSLEEVQKTPMWDTLIPEDELDQVKAVFNQLLQGKYPNHHQNHWLGKDGTQHLINWSNTALTDPRGRITNIVAIGIDISEQQKLEEQFLRAQRLESIGMIASGIAHDLNNILTPIMAISQLLPLKVPNLDEENLHLLQMMQDSARRASKLVSQVLAFSRGVEGDRSPLQLRHIVSEISNIASKTFPKTIELSVDIPRDLWVVNGDPTQLHQVLMNLCVNARDAMPTGGTLQISAINLQIDDKFARSYLEAQVGPYILLTVADTGVGISESDLKRIFDPFFTTKSPGQGTGLGLSTVHGIVKNHGGFIRVYSELEKGTQFKIFLPALESSEASQAIDPALPRGHGELILVIDDEAPICESTQSILEAYHYRVLTGSDGIEAIALYAQHKSEIQVVLMDMTMPKLDCATAVQTLQRMDPNVKIILISGLASNEPVALKMASGVKAFLPKPFSSTVLLRTLSRILDASSLNA